MLNRKHQKPKLTERLSLIFDQDDNVNPVTKVIIAIGEAIRQQADTVTQAATEQEQVGNSASLDDFYQYQYLDGIIEEEIYIIEDLLAISYVICQTDIEYVVTHTKKLIEYVKSEHAHTLSLASKKPDLMKLDPFMVNPNTTAIQAINAYANYFKHKDAWTDSWDNILRSNSQSKDTVSVLVATGAIAQSSYNLSVTKNRGAASGCGTCTTWR